MTFDASEVAARLTKARADRTAIGSLSAELGPFDLACAYEVQRLLRREAGPLAGWKLGVTSRAKQAQVGVHEPVRGFLAARDGLDLGAPLAVAEHIQPRCEPEIVFIMGADLSGPSVTSSAVVATAAGAAALGHPAAAVAWLVRSLAAENEGLRAGDIVLSGGLTAAVPVRAGDVVTVTADRLGTVELGCVLWSRTGLVSLPWSRWTARMGGRSGRSRTPGGLSR